MNEEQNNTKKTQPAIKFDGTQIGNEHVRKNIYPYVRHLTLILFVLIGFFIIIFLMHQNGKSIYEHGI